MKRIRKTFTRLLIPAAILGIAVVLLAFDLSARGVAWRALWSVTGEEAPLAQLRGAAEYGATLLRAQPQLAPNTAITYTDGCPFGVNTFLEQEVEPEKRERQLQMISDAGFCWIRQQFPWEEIEIHARGDFLDRRNEAAIGIVDAWAKFDHIVALAEQYNVRIHARLDNPPDWAHADPAIGEKAPPDDLQDFVNYAVAVATRYRGRLQFYQVWNEPNIYPEWGNQPVDPIAYTELLCRTYDALKAVDPSIVVISGAMAQTVALDGLNLSDLVYLQRLYDAGAGRCFDILSAQAYGFNSGPTDRRLRTTAPNFARVVLLRDLMVANGDARKPIWISEAAWNPIDAPDVPPDVANRELYGIATRDQAARYAPLAYQRVIEEWDWVGVMHYWFFKRASDAEQNQAWYYFRLVEPNFMPTATYDALRDYMRGVRGLPLS